MLSQRHRARQLNQQVLYNLTDARGRHGHFTELTIALRYADQALGELGTIDKAGDCATRAQIISMHALRGEILRRQAVRDTNNHYSYQIFNQARDDLEPAEQAILALINRPGINPDEKAELAAEAGRIALFTGLLDLSQELIAKQRGLARFAYPLAHGSAAIERAYRYLTEQCDAHSNHVRVHTTIFGWAAAKLNGNVPEAETWKDRLHDELGWTREHEPYRYVELGWMALKAAARLTLPGGAEGIILSGYTPDATEVHDMCESDR